MSEPDWNWGDQSRNQQNQWNNYSPDQSWNQSANQSADYDFYTQGYDSLLLRIHI